MSSFDISFPTSHCVSLFPLPLSLSFPPSARLLSSSICIHFKLVHFNLFTLFAAANARIWQLLRPVWNWNQHLQSVILTSSSSVAFGRSEICEPLYVFVKSTSSFPQLVWPDLLTSPCSMFSFTSLPVCTFASLTRRKPVFQDQLFWFPMIAFLSPLFCLCW